MRKIIFMLFLPMMVFSQEFKRPPMLIKNEGQLRSTVSGYSPKEVLYYMQTPKLDFYITDHGLTYVFKKIEKSEGRFDDARMDSVYKITMHYQRIDVEFLQAHIDPQNVEEEKDPVATVSFYNELVPEGLEHRPIYRRILLKEIYPHVDIEFVASNEMLKYNLILHPGANIDDIRFEVRGAKDFLFTDSVLTITSEFSSLQEGPIYAFLTSGKKIPVYFKELPNGNIGFDLRSNQDITLNETVIIDPPLYWSTFYAGSGYDDGMQIVSAGTAIYGLIYTVSSDFPVQNASGAYIQSIIGGNYDWAIVKFSLSGQLLWASFYGGSANDKPLCLSYGKVLGVPWLVVGGNTYSTDMPTRNPGIGNFFQGSLNGDMDAFIVLFGANDSRVWATYMGGSYNNSTWDREEYFDLYVDTVSSSIWAVGSTFSSDFPVQSSGSFYYDNTYNGDNDVFIQRFSSTLSLTYSTYFGGDQTDNQPRFDVNASQEKMISFQTTSTNLPLVLVDVTSYQQNYVGGSDIYAALFNSNMQHVFGTYVGHTADEYMYDVLSVDSLWFLTGATKSSNYPVTNVYGFSYYHNTFIGASDGFLTAFNNKGKLVYSTYLGTSQLDAGRSMAYDKNRRYFYVFGYVGAGGSIPQADPGDCSLYRTTLGGQDAFIMQFDSTFTPLWTTHYGGGNTDDFKSGTITSDGTIYLTGFTLGNVLLANPAPGVAYVDSTFNGVRDAVFAAFKLCPVNFNTVSASATAACVNDVILLSASGGTTYVWSTGSTSSSVDVTLQHDTSIIVTATNAWGCCETDTVQLIAYPLPVLHLVGPDSVCEQTTQTYTVSGADSYLWSNNATDSTTTYDFNTAGTYHENVIGITANGCRDTLYFDVYAIPLPVASINVDTTLCDVDSVQICGAGGIYYYWNIPGSTPDSTTTCFYYYPNPGSTTVELMVKDNYGCSSLPVQKEIEKTTAPNLFQGDTTYKCPENSLTLTYGVVGTVIWNTGDTATSIVVSNPGMYMVTYIDSINCNYYDSIYVVNYNVISVQIDTLPAGFCNNASQYDLEANQPGGVWSGQGIIDSTNGTFDPSMVSPGIYEIVYVYTDSNQCQSKDTALVEVYALPFVEILSHPSGLCHNAGMYGFGANVSGGIWNGAGIVDSTIGTFDPSSVEPGTYEVMYVYTDTNLCQVKDTTWIDVYEVPDVDVSTVKETCQGAKDGQIIMSGNQGTPPYDYYLNAQLSESIVTQLAPGSYQVYVIDNNNCTSDIKTIEVLPGDYPCDIMDVYIPNIFSPNGDNENDVFTAYSKFISTMHLIVFDRYGEKVFESFDPNNSWDGTYKGSPVEEGVYFYYFTGKLDNGKFVKRAGSVHLVR